MLTLTYYNRRTKKGFKIDLQRFFACVGIVALMVSFTALTVDSFRYPERYFTTWKYGEILSRV